MEELWQGQGWSNHGKNTKLQGKRQGRSFIRDERNPLVQCPEEGSE